MAVEMHIHDVPADVWEAIVADAEEQGTSRTEVATAILARRFRVRHTPSGAPFRRGELDVNEPLKLRVPEGLRAKIRMEAARHGATIRGVVVGTLAEEYGLPAPRTARKPRVRS
jgi:hypothetical protein